MNRNVLKSVDFRYTRQQELIKEICRELDLIAYYPNYHAQKTDNNTVIIYTKDNHEYNESLSKYALSEEYKPYVCYLENTDINGHFDLSFMNRSQIDLRGLQEKEKIKRYIENSFAKYISENM